MPINMSDQKEEIKRMDPQNCNVCSAPIQGPYCINCGQKIGQEETSMISMIKDLVSNVFSLERSVIANTFIILKDPKRVILNYWEGNRKYYPSPGKFLFYALAVAAIHISLIDNNVLGLHLNVGEVKAQFTFWIICLPLLVLTSYLSFIRRKQRFTRHFVSIVYIASTLFIVISVLNGLLIKILGKDFLTGAVFMFFLGLIFIWNAIVFVKKTSFSRVLLNALLQTTVFFSIIFAIGFLINQINPGVFSWD